MKPECLNHSNINLRWQKKFADVRRFTGNPHSLISVETIAIALVIKNINQ